MRILEVGEIGPRQEKQGAQNVFPIFGMKPFYRMLPYHLPLAKIPVDFIQVVQKYVGHYPLVCAGKVQYSAVAGKPIPKKEFFPDR